VDEMQPFGKDRNAIFAFILVVVQFTVLTAAIAGNSYAAISFKDITPNGFGQVVHVTAEFNVRGWRYIYQGRTAQVQYYTDTGCNYNGCNAAYSVAIAVLVLASIADFLYLWLIFQLPFLFNLNNGRGCLKWTSIVLSWLAWGCNFSSWIICISGFNYWAGQMANTPNFFSYLTSTLSSLVVTSGLPAPNIPGANIGGSTWTTTAVSTWPSYINQNYLGGDMKPYASFWADLAANIIGTVSTILITRLHVHPYGSNKAIPAVPLSVNA